MIKATFDPVSNREQWTNTSEVRDQDGNLVDLSAATIVVTLRDKIWKSMQLTATTADGTITIPSTGFFTWTFTESQMRGLEASIAYEIGCVISIGGVAQQFFIGTVPVLDGVVD